MSTMGSLVQSMLHHMMEAHALTTWLLLEITTTGRVLAWSNTAEEIHSVLQGCVCVCETLHTLTSMVHSRPACRKSVTKVIRWSSSVTPRRVWWRRNEQIYSSVLYSRRERSPTLTLFDRWMKINTSSYLRCPFELGFGFFKRLKKTQRL